MNTVRAGSSTAFIAANTFAPLRSPIACSTNLRCILCVPNIPHSMPSASPMWTSIAAISVFRRRISICAYACEMPLRCVSR
jgi:hypothetical protein